MTRVLDAAWLREDFDLEALENVVRTAVLAIGAASLGGFMSKVGRRRAQEAPVCRTCRQPMRSSGPRKKRILTILGEADYERTRYACETCHAASFPADKILDITDTSRSPGVRRQVARLGAKEPFREVAQDLKELAGVELSRKDAERISEAVGKDLEAWDARNRSRARFQQPPPADAPKAIENFYVEMDGTGVPMVFYEVRHRKGKQPDGSAKTREAKLGCIFTQTILDAQGNPVRDPGSTTFTGAIEEAALFGTRIYAEAVQRGLYNAKRVVVLSDAAEWIKKIIEMHFPMAIHIIDFYHAKQHVSALCQALFSKPEQIARYREQWWELLYQGDIEAIVHAATSYLPRDPSDNKDAWRECNYLTKNIPHMRYANFRRQGLFIGSGIIEAACKNVVGKRLKQSGMEWTVEGANSITALRCASLSSRLVDYWEQRVA